jgi:hypothetical protein
LDYNQWVGGFALHQFGITNQLGLEWTTADYWTGYEYRMQMAGEQPQVLSIVKNGTDQSGYIDGALQLSGTVVDAVLTPVTTLTVGGYFDWFGYGYYSGQIAEILIYNRALSATERESVEAALASKYLPGEVDPDADMNGLEDAWEVLYFGHSGVGLREDPDGDGITNLDEFLAGSDPTDYYNGVPPLVSIVTGGAGELGPDGLFAVLVTDSEGEPHVNAPVFFEVTGTATRFATNPDSLTFYSTGSVRTNADGVASVYVRGGTQ